MLELPPSTDSTILEGCGAQHCPQGPSSVKKHEYYNYFCFGSLGTFGVRIPACSWTGLATLAFSCTHTERDGELYRTTSEVISGTLLRLRPRSESCRVGSVLHSCRLPSIWHSSWQSTEKCWVRCLQYFKWLIASLLLVSFLQKHI